MQYYYHYTHSRLVEEIRNTGMYFNHTYFTIDEYYNPYQAGQFLGVRTYNINCVLKFRDDGQFVKWENVPTTGRFLGGGTQFSHPRSLKPIACRNIYSKFWRRL